MLCSFMYKLFASIAYIGCIIVLGASITKCLNYSYERNKTSHAPIICLKFCSGEKLLDCVKKSGGLPEKGGQKNYAPDGSWLEAKHLEVWYRERRETLEKERIKSELVF